MIKVQGSLEQAKELVLGKDTVYLHTNIIEIESGLFEYDEIQMTYSEYSDYLQSQLLEKEMQIIELEMGGLL